ncbi:MAG TPA: TraR/DksA family transcriptional regulator [Gemmataceae bacterium]|nr:TraR/DksA family transcriptional regulator [Gemmataceae bacterium]
MSKSELQKHRNQLEDMIARLHDEEAHLRHKVMRAEEPSGIAEQEPYHNPEEERAELAQNEIALSVLENEDSLLGECQAALQRIKKGKYGICESCAHTIGQKRLNAAPYARFCVRCAREATPD